MKSSWRDKHQTGTRGNFQFKIRNNNWQVATNSKLTFFKMITNYGNKETHNSSNSLDCFISLLVSCFLFNFYIYFILFFRNIIFIINITQVVSWIRRKMKRIDGWQAVQWWCWWWWIVKIDYGRRTWIISYVYLFYCCLLWRVMFVVSYVDWVGYTLCVTNS